MLGNYQSKLEKIKSGGKTKTQIGGVSENKRVVSGKGGKFAVTEKEKKFEESGVTRKKKNYVMYESKLGTEKEQNLQKLHDAPKPKAKPKPAEPKPRQEERIFQTKKRVEYLDNYQYHETKDIKDNDPKKQCIVTHQRLGDIVGGSYETSTYTKQTLTDSGTGPKLYSSSTTTTSSKKDARGRPTGTTSTTRSTRTTSASRTLPAVSKEQRSIQKYSTNTSVPSKPSASTTESVRTAVTKVKERITSVGRGRTK